MKTKKTRKQRTWRDVPDEIILCLASKDVTRAESLCPTAGTVERFAQGDPRAVAILLAWKFNFPVRVD
jgi:hypothetical protein